MRLENMAIALRPRSAWEAIDLGYAMVQTWWLPLMKAWCAVYLPLALLINLLCWKYPPLAVMILWWLKPAFDRVVLHVLSGTVFGATPSLRETLAALKKLWWKNGLFAALTYARFNPARSFTLPVVQLEGSRGKLAAKRRRVLAREGSGAALGLTVMSMFVEVTMLFSIYLLANLFSPGEPIFNFSWQSMMNPEKDQAAHYLSNAINAGVISILEPFYVAAGFAIYLNCRTAIEGWDVELQFKRMAVRLAAVASGSSESSFAATKPAVAPRNRPRDSSPLAAAKRAAMLILAIGGMGFAVSPIDRAIAQTNSKTDAKAEAKDETKAEAKVEISPPSSTSAPNSAENTGSANSAETNADTSDAEWSCKKGDEAPPGGDPNTKDGVSKSDAETPHTGAVEAAKRVLESKDFGEYQKSWQINYIGPSWDKEKTKKKTDHKWLMALAEFFAKSARVIAWIGGTLLVLFLIYLIARHVGLKGWGVGKRNDMPEVLFGLDVRPESLPENISAAASKLLFAGDIRGAVSLLYRAALVSLIQDGRIDIARGDTELELVARVRRAYGSDAGGEAKSDYFANLVSVWQRIAYARQTLASADITSLIEAWSAHFSIRRGATASPLHSAKMSIEAA